MIRTEELMIGNWVIVDDKPVQVQSITKKKIGFHNNPGKVRLLYARNCELIPIPITDDLLLKMGFKKDGKRFYFHGETYFELFYLGKLYVATVNHAEYQIGEPIAYLHQLQNLYYSLETKRLKIKL